MATPHTIPSILSEDLSEVLAESEGDHLYITAILIQGTVIIDDVSMPNLGPIALPSPIICQNFTPDAVGQVAYYQQ